MGDSKYFNTSLSEDSVTGSLGSLKMFYTKQSVYIRRVPQIDSAIKQKRMFSVTTCNDNFSTQYKRWWPNFYEKNTMSVQTNG
jgi:hypothetical protein